MSKVKHKAEDLVAKNYARDASPQYKLGQKDAQEVLAKLAGKEGYQPGVTKEAVLEQMVDYLTQIEGYYGGQIQPLEIEIPKQPQIAYQKQTDYDYKQEQKLPSLQQSQNWYEQQHNMNTQQLNSKSLNGYYQEDKSCCEKYCTIFRVQETKYDHPLLNLIYNGGSKIADLLQGAACNLSELLHSFDTLSPTAQELALDCIQQSNAPLLQELLGDHSSHEANA